MRHITKSFMATLESHRQLTAGAAPFLTLESIAFQHNDSFGPEIEAIVMQYKDLVDAGANQKAIRNAKELKTALEATIYRRLGISVSLVTDSYLAATIPNVFIPHNPVIQDVAREIFELWGKGGQDKLEKLKNNTVVGTVNTEKATVSGWFSQQKAPLFVNFKTLLKNFKLTVPQVTAVILHELGHDFNAIIFSANVNTTNQIIADIARHITSSDRGGDVNYIFSKIKQIDPKASKDIAKSLASGNRVVMSMGTFRLLNMASQSIMANHVYDRTSFEALSDQFTARFGYATHLVTALDVLDKEFSEYEQAKYQYTCSWISLLIFGMTAMIYAMITIMPATSLFIRVLAGLISYFYSMIFGLILDANRVSTKDRTYDNIRDRYLRMRLQLVELIKNPETTREAKVALLEEIKLMDTIIVQKKVFESPITKIMLAVSSKDQRAAENIKLQRDIEELIANDLFVAAGQLETKEGV